jgi:hypothetical protein
LKISATIKIQVTRNPDDGSGLPGLYGVSCQINVGLTSVSTITGSMHTAKTKTRLNGNLRSHEIGLIVVLCK